MDNTAANIIGRPTLRDIGVDLLNRGDSNEVSLRTCTTTDFQEFHQSNNDNYDLQQCRRSNRLKVRRSVIGSTKRRHTNDEDENTIVDGRLAVTSTPAPKSTQQKAARLSALSKRTPTVQQTVTRNSYGLLEFPVSPITERSASKTLGPNEETRNEHRSIQEYVTTTVERRFDEHFCPSPDGSVTGCFDRSRSQRCYTRTPKKKNWQSSSLNSTVDNHSPENLNGFLALEGLSSYSSKKSRRGRNVINNKSKDKSPLPGGCYSPPTVVKRKPRKKERPVWDEARYSHIFEEINREFAEIERTELCVEFEDPSKAHHFA